MKVGYEKIIQVEKALIVRIKAREVSKKSHVFTQQPEGVHIGGNEDLVYKLKRLIYCLKQASKKWYLKFDGIVTFIRIRENKVDQCMYLKVSGSKFIFMLYVDHILLTFNDHSMLHETKWMLTRCFDINDVNEDFLCYGSRFIEIDHATHMRCLKRRIFIVLRSFNTQN